MAKRRRPVHGRRRPVSARPRRRWLVGVAAVAVAATLWLAGTQLRREARATIVRTADQNVLLLTIDTLRADALGSYGGRAATPNLDRLAGRGVRFDFAHAHAVMTLPSHASILTGQYPFQHGIRDNSGFRLAAGTATLATRLRAQGFATGAFVGAFPLDSQFGLDQGFDRYNDQFGVSHAPTDFSLAERRADAVVAAAREWIARQSGRWLAWVHVFDPHARYDPPAPFDVRYAGDPYLGEVAYTDHALGPLLDQVAGLANRATLVILTSDHGEALGDHGEATHGLFAYEATLRVPLVVAQLGTTHAVAGVTSPVAARHVDLLPTILDALELDTRGETLAGRSLLDAGAEPRASYFEALTASLNRGWAPLTGVLLGREKFIDLPVPELYDLAADAAEQQNLVDARPDRRQVLAGALESFGASPVIERRRERPEVEARLRALGYVSGEAPRRTQYTDADDPKRLVDLDRAIHDAIDRYQRGHPREAVEVYRQIIERRPDMAIAYRHLAFVYWDLGETDGAIRTLERAMRTGLTPEGIQAQLGNYLAESGDPGRAAALLQPLAGREGAEPDTLNALGIALARLGRLDEAIAVFERILEVDPGHAMALENIGNARLRRGDLAGARDALERAAAANPWSAAAHTGLGAIALRSGDRERAIGHWRRAVELDPANFDALFNLGTELVNAGRFDEARPWLERFVREAPRAHYDEDIRRVAALLEAGGR